MKETTKATVKIIFVLAIILIALTAIILMQPLKTNEKESSYLNSQKMISLIEVSFENKEYENIVLLLGKAVETYGEESMSEVLNLRSKSLKLIIERDLQNVFGYCQENHFLKALDELESLLSFLTLHDYAPPEVFYDLLSVAAFGYLDQRMRGI